MTYKTSRRKRYKSMFSNIFWDTFHKHLYYENNRTKKLRFKYTAFISYDVMPRHKLCLCDVKKFVIVVCPFRWEHLVFLSYRYGLCLNRLISYNV